MNISDLRIMLEEVVYNTLYVSSKMNQENKKKIKKIKDYLKTSETFISDIRYLIMGRNNENYAIYNQFIGDFFVCSTDTIKLEILNNQENYEDIIKEEKIFEDILESLEVEKQYTYFQNKKKFTSLDILLINKVVSSSGCFQDNLLLSEILNNEKIRKKIAPYSISLNYSYALLPIIHLNDYEMCHILTKETYTQFLLKKCKNFDDFYHLYSSNEEIYHCILSRSLVFDSTDNEKIYKFILEHPNFIGKFINKYLDLFSMVEIIKMSELKNLDNEAFCVVIQRLYQFNEKDATVYFNEENLRKCPKHSIDVYPFHHMNEKLKQTIFQNYSLFNRFIDTIIIEAINNHFEEEDIVSILRNDIFILDMSSYAIELLLNKLSFKATFNMLQRKIIFDKITHLNVRIDNKDALFVKGFLDSPVLVQKSEHHMLYDMLQLLNKEDVLYYILLPFIMNHLSNYEIIQLVIEKDIKIEDVLFHEEIHYKFSLTDIIQLIDGYFEKRIVLDIFRDKNLCTKLFHLSDEVYKKIDFDEVNYLFETVQMKSILSKQETKVTVLSYKSVLCSYLVFGLEETLRLVNKGNSDITLDEIKKLQKDIVNEKILIFKENNSTFFQNMSKKIMDYLLSIENFDNKNEFAEQLRKNIYIDHVIYFMLENNFASYNAIVDTFYSYVKYYQYNPFASNKEIYDYINRFMRLFFDNKINEYNKEFERIILQNFKVKESVDYKRRKDVGKDYLNKLKLKLFVRTLTEPNKEMYSVYFKNPCSLDDIKNKYINYLAHSEVDFDSILEHVLIPYMNDRFDKENCLYQLGIKKPKNTDDYKRYLEDIRFITKLNSKMVSYKKKYGFEEMLAIMHSICYSQDLPVSLTKKETQEIAKLSHRVPHLSGELFVDKSVLKFIYKDNLDIYNIEEIIEYNNYLEILEGILKKTFQYISKNMDDEKVKNAFLHDYFKTINCDKKIFPIHNKYYEPRVRVLSLHDLEIIFNGYDFNELKPIDKDLEKFLFDKKNLVMVVDGYYEGIVDNLGLIISKWDKIKEYIAGLNKTVEVISLIGIENILTLMHFQDDILGKVIDKDIVCSIYEDGYYEVNDLNKRIDILIDLFKESYKRITSTIPYLSYKDGIYKVEILDTYNKDILRSNKASLYKVGAVGNDFLHYSILNKNGLQIGIYKNEQLVSKILGVRNGNTIYLNALEGDNDANYNELLRLFANELIRITKDEAEPIEYVTIVNNSQYESCNGLKLDTTICPIINDPINKIYYDFEVFKEYKHLLHVNAIYTNYKDNISTLLSSSQIVDQNNFKYYDVEDKYYRIRKPVIKLSNNIGEEYINRVKLILYLCKLENDSVAIENVMLSSMKTIYLGDDYVILVSERGIVFTYELPYDERAKKEIALIMKSIKEEN